MPRYIKRIPFSRNKINGFTIMELIIVIGVIGAIATVSIGAINNSKQQELAKDASKISNLEKSCSSIETFFELENGKYPASSDENNPLTGDDSATLSQYISTWPKNYIYNYDASTNDFSVHVEAARSTFFKCGSVFKGITECAADTDPASVTECNFVEGGLGSNIAFCGNKTCDVGENSVNCEIDCGEVTLPPPDDECALDSDCTGCAQGECGVCYISVSPTACTCVTCAATEQLDQQNPDANTGPFTNNKMYQSFIAGITGNLSKVEIKVGNSSSTGNLYIRNGAGTSGEIIATNSDGFNGSNGWQPFSFGSAPAITAGNVYTIDYAVSTGRPNYYYSGNLYPGGTLNDRIQNDLGFKTYVLN